MLLQTASARLLFALVLSLSATSLHAQNESPVGRIVAGRFLVAYRNATIPGDAEVRTRTAGARLIRRHDRFGIALVQGSAASAAALAAQPNVEYVLQDRILTGHALTFAPAISFAPAPAPAAPVQTGQAPVQIAPAGNFDGLYNSAQEWAVRQAGGYGAGVPGGPSVGPWNITMGKGVRIAILDSGIDATHPDLSSNLALNLSEIDQTALPSPCDDGSPQDQQGHGTWTASLAAAALGPGTGDLVGVAPQATLLNIKVLERLPAVDGDSRTCAAGQASGLLSWVLQGIDDAVAQRADIVSMSLGTLVDLSTGDGAGLKATFDRVTYAATQAGVILIAAAGNDGFDLSNRRYIELPAQARGVLAIVASTNAACAENLVAGATCAPGPVTLPYYSNFGAPLNALAAPGGSYPAGPDADPSHTSGWVRGACSSGLPNTLDGAPIDAQHSLGCFGLGHTAYVQAMGTSAAAPLAAGVAALLIAAHPTWDAASILAVMRNSARPASGQLAPQIDANAALSAVHP